MRSIITPSAGTASSSSCVRSMTLAEEAAAAEAAPADDPWTTHDVDSELVYPFVSVNDDGVVDRHTSIWGSPEDDRNMVRTQQS